MWSHGANILCLRLVVPTLEIRESKSMPAAGAVLSLSLLFAAAAALKLSNESVLVTAAASSPPVPVTPLASALVACGVALATATCANGHASPLRHPLRDEKYLHEASIQREETESEIVNIRFSINGSSSDSVTK